MPLLNVPRFLIFRFFAQDKTLSSFCFQPYRKKVANLPVGYLDLDGIWAAMRELQRNYPNIIQIINLTSYGPGWTYEGREMPMLKLSDNVIVDEDEPNILIVSAHHAREIITPHIALDIINRLVAGYNSNDTRLRSIVENNEIFISPLWNPDGYYHVWEVDNMWRKNKKPNAGGSYGVDQNRNYPYGWSASCSGSNIPNSETYKGVSAASEEETQIMIEFSKTRIFAKVNDFHSYGREVLYSFVCEPFTPNLDVFITNEAITLANQVGTRYATRTPSGDGQHQQWHIKEATAYAFLTETHTEFQPDYDEVEQEAEYLWPMNLYFLERPIPYSGHVYSAANFAPLTASISVSNTNNVYWKSHPKYGSFYLFLPDGQYTIIFSASGYAPRSVPVVITNSSPQTNQNVYLNPI